MFEFIDSGLFWFIFTLKLFLVFISSSINKIYGIVEYDVKNIIGGAGINIPRTKEYKVITFISLLLYIPAFYPFASIPMFFTLLLGSVFCNLVLAYFFIKTLLKRSPYINAKIDLMVESEIQILKANLEKKGTNF
ncbi:hypothetical protein BKP35_10435 [Anaerobacillus arseniciselenatis]|uniref:Uncharacterized protein n=1 Tax=Anaerobacillus arseniciselenatis TaxID=85682 RepID=A0A1S2LKA4_9BACI|nr:hypothetical protein [Anaerobacillus arseniciselenatis]OIJ12968.1 hypothetical protein BKP35_10435 [Anaerobacillus arseniciselenatis]